MPPQKSTPQKATPKAIPKATQKATQKSTAEKSTPQKATSQKATQKSTAQKSTQKSSGEGTESPPDDKGNWYNLWEALAGSAKGNTNTVRGSGNNTILIGTDNKNELDGNKNLVAEHGARNENKSKGHWNKIGLKGEDISHAPEESINKRVIHLTNLSKPKKGSTTGDQQRGNKGNDIVADQLQRIRHMCNGYLSEGYNWDEVP
nr:hypothetical protein FVER53263_12473 [Fusarium verticillioides]